MVREICVNLYLLIFKGIFNFCKLFSLKDKVVFLITFGDNSQYVFEEIKRRRIPVEVVILYKGSSKKYFQSYENIGLIPYESMNLFHTVRSIYHLATSKYIFIDNYFGALAVTKFKKDVQCIQLWHASGALKKFGLEDQSIRNRSKRAQKRFLEVYDRFHKVIVGSDVMANIFMKAFNLSGERILKTGIPRTDFFFNQDLHNEIIHKFVRANDILKYKKKILYAPTYRDNELESFNLKLDLQAMYEELGNDYVILLRLHPAVKCDVNYAELFPGFVFDYSSSKYDINELLLLSNYLITDYSSIAYEYSLLNRPMIFYAYDLEDYQEERGLWGQYESMVPGPVVRNTIEIINLIKKDQFELEKMVEYADKWNKYSNGHSSENLVSYVFEKKKTPEQSKLGVM